MGILGEREPLEEGGGETLTPEHVKATRAQLGGMTYLIASYFCDVHARCKQARRLYMCDVGSAVVVDRVARCTCMPKRAQAPSPR